MDPDFPVLSVQKANVIVNNVSPFYALVGVGLGAIVAILANGCASPASADEARPVIVDLQYHTVTETIGHRETYVTPDGITIEVEPATLVLYER